jgi:hypothetical protein
LLLWQRECRTIFVFCNYIPSVFNIPTPCKAVQIVESTGDRAAAYQLARHLESVDRVEDAIKYYSRSGCFSNAIRLAKENNLKQLMLGLALRSSKADMIEASFHGNIHVLSPCSHLGMLT